MNVSSLIHVPGTPGALDSSIAEINAANSAKTFLQPGQDELEYLRNRAQAGEDWAIDKYLDYVLSERSANTARAWTANREDNQYQRLVSDLKKAGINPYYALQGASPVSSSTQGVNYQGNYRTSSKKLESTQENTWIRALFALFGVAVGALLA